MEDTPLPTLTFEGDAAGAVIQSLLHQRQLLLLSEEQLLQITHITGDLQKTLFNEIDYRLIGRHRSWTYGNRYCDLSESVDVFLRDFGLVMKLSQNQNECFRLLLSRAFVSELRRGRGCFDSDFGSESNFVHKFDMAMLELFRRQTKYMEARGVANWDATVWFNAVKEVREKYRSGYYMKDEDGKAIKKRILAGDFRYLPSTALFETSFLVLKTWLRKNYAHMVACKVAGGILPVELADLIAGELYDKELLGKVLGED